MTEWMNVVSHFIISFTDKIDEIVYQQPTNNNEKTLQTV